MDTPTRSIFREKSLERLATPRQFNNSLNVTKVSVWVALVAILVLLGGLLVWAVFGFVELTVKTPGLAEHGVVTCYVPGDAVVAVGMEARVDSIQDAQSITPGAGGVVTDVALITANREEIVNNPALSVDFHNAANHSFAVTISAPSAQDGMVHVTILRDRIRPISFLTGS